MNVSIVGAETNAEFFTARVEGHRAWYFDPTAVVEVVGHVSDEVDQSLAGIRALAFNVMALDADESEMITITFTSCVVPYAKASLTRTVHGAGQWVWDFCAGNQWQVTDVRIAVPNAS